MDAPRKLYLDVDLARDLLWRPVGTVHESFEVVDREDHDRLGRWSVGGALIIRHVATGALYYGAYSEGATEMQSEEPWDWDDKAEFHMVKPVPVQTIKYEAVTA
jgi:hypothetical protein